MSILTNMIWKIVESNLFSKKKKSGEIMQIIGIENNAWNIFLMYEYK